MELIKKLCNGLLDTETEEAENDSAKYTEQRKKCEDIYNDIYNSLNEQQKKKLVSLDWAYFKLSGIWKEDGFKEGFEKGFKQSMRLIIDCLRD